MTETKYNKKSDEGKVLVLYTGGTIGMMRNKDEGKVNHILQTKIIHKTVLGKGAREGFNIISEYFQRIKKKK